MNDLKQRLDAALSESVWSAADKARVIGQIDKGDVKMKRRLPVAVLVCVLVLAVSLTAFALTKGFGILDFAKRYDGVSVPEDADKYIDERNDLLFDNEYACIRLGEVIYDGGYLRFTAEVTPKAEDVFPIMLDCQPSDSYDEAMTVGERYAAGGFTRALCVSLMPEIQQFDGGITMDWAYSGDKLVLYYECRCTETAEPLNEVGLVLTAGMLDGLEAAQDGIITESGTFEVTITQSGAVYECNTPAEYPSCGVTVQRLEIRETPLELEYAIYFTVTDAEAYNNVREGLFFELIDPESTETELAAQRLGAGVSGSAGIESSSNGFVQTGCIAKAELRDVYYIRAFNFAEENKPRYETRAFEVEISG